jgi:hypothetical protein
MRRQDPRRNGKVAQIVHQFQKGGKMDKIQDCGDLSGYAPIQ